MAFSNGLYMKTNPSGSGRHQNDILTHNLLPPPPPFLKDKEPCVLCLPEKAEGGSPCSHSYSTHTQSTPGSLSGPDSHLSFLSPESYACIDCADLLQCLRSSLTPPCHRHFPGSPPPPRVPHAPPSGHCLLPCGKGCSCVSILQTLSSGRPASCLSV